MRGQGIEVLALFFETPFFPSTKAVQSAKTIKLDLKVIDITDRYLPVLKNPSHGYGENLNPCIDCHILMIRAAGKRLEQEGASFIITGEVLGQRPMSQNREALSIVATESGFEGLILRPLSAKHLPITVPEERGWVKREELMDFSGRSRKPQMELAKRFHIKEYPSPAGGCLLTDGVFSRRLRDLLASGWQSGRRQIELLKLGRHFRISPKTKVIVGRNQRENRAIECLSEKGDLLLVPVSVPGPTVLVLGEISPEVEALAAAMTVSYSDAMENESTEVRLTGKRGDETRWGKGGHKSEFRDYMI
jgi:hypothetical protein